MSDKNNNEIDSTYTHKQNKSDSVSLSVRGKEEKEILDDESDK